MEKEKKEDLQVNWRIYEDTNPRNGTRKGYQYGGNLFEQGQQRKQFKAYLRKRLVIVIRRKASSGSFRICSSTNP